MTCLIIVEGQSDEGFIKGIADRVGTQVHVRLMRGNKPDKAARLIRAALRQRSYGKVILLKDTHALSEDKVRKLGKEALKQVPHPNKHLIIVKEAIESWVLAGMGERGAESLSDPHHRLAELLAREGKALVKSEGLYRELVKEMDLRAACRNSATLREFLNVLRDP